MGRIKCAVDGVLAEKDPKIARAKARAILPDLAELARRLARVRRADPGLAVGFGPAVDRVIRLAGRDPDGLLLADGLASAGGLAFGFPSDM
ncbi:MAG: hypothetical protein JXP34_26165 [Planctomycetes bacterium]|nr:hypothetical protein [Planctomycetota bacterium]